MSKSTVAKQEIAQSKKQVDLLSVLRSCERNAWNGLIQCHDNSDQVVGTVLFRSGRVVWCISKYQSEDLGSFLWRLGRVTKNELRDLRKAYDEHGGKIHLGELVEQRGLVAKPILRRCIMLHVRQGLDALLSTAIESIELKEELIESETISGFSLRTLIGGEEDDGYVGETTSARWLSWTDENAILKQFANLGGYLGSCIMSIDGAVLAAHSQEQVDATISGVWILEILESSRRAEHRVGLGIPTELQIETKEGVVVANVLGEPPGYLVVLLARNTCSVGMVRYQLSQARDRLLRWATRQQPAEPSR